MQPHLVCVGGEDHALRIPFLLALRDRGFEVTAVSSGDGAAFARRGLSHHPYAFDRFGSIGGAWGAIRQLRRLMKQLKPDIVQSFDTKPNLLMPLASRGAVPLIRTINGLGWVFSSTEPRARALRPVFCGLQRLVSRWTALTVFQNQDDQAFFAQRGLLGPGGRDRLIVSSGIDPDAFRQAQQGGPSPDALRNQLGLGTAEIVLFVGRLTRQKGIPTLLDAIPTVLAQRKHARFVLVGPRESEGPFAVDQAEIDELAPHAIALGPRSDVPALLGMADVFAFPTEYREGVPRVLLEAGLAGLPIVATRMPGCSDIVEDGQNGYLVKPRDPDALAARIIDLLRDPIGAKAMGTRARSLVRERFNLARVVEQYCDAYARVLSGSATDEAEDTQARRVTETGHAQKLGVRRP
ncbi:MAG: glycosyl transferase family 1 [Kaistia sp. SCN 65-12]|nr:MAG: glycosyl transferase family 1 [Kaistia sp. SCN 65-12]